MNAENRCASSSPASATWAAAMRSPITAIRASRSSALVNRSDVGAAAGARRLSAIRRLFEAACATRSPTSSRSTPIPTAMPTIAVTAMEAGAHVFVEKPLATTVADAERVVAAAQRQRPQAGDRLHPAPPPVLDAVDRRGARARRPFVLRMNLNQQSSGPTWETHKRADADDLADRRLRRALCRRDVPDHRRQAGRGARHGRCGSPTRSRRTCTTTAICRSSSTTARSAGTRPAGAR